MADEMIKDNVPPYVHNKHTSYENTVLSMLAGITSDQEGKSISNALLEVRARFYIGSAMLDKAPKFIEENWQRLYDAEYKKLEGTNYNKQEREAAALAGMWVELGNLATTFFAKKYKVDGAKAKIAVIDTMTSDGKPIAEMDSDPEVSYTPDKYGV